MYEFLVLARLSRRPMHGYLIARIIGDIIGPFRRIHWGALYPLLRRLEQAGLILGEACCEGRPQRIYSLTDAGRERLRELLLDTEHHLAEYGMLFAHKVTMFSELAPEERIYLCRHYAVHAQQNIDHLQRERRDLVENAYAAPEELDDILTAVDHRVAVWQRERAWAEELIERNHVKEAV